MFVELNNDQRREIINTRQRYQAWRNAVDREHGYRGSMVWDESRSHQYLLRSFYDETGKRRQKSLGKLSDETSTLKENFDTERAAALASRKSLDEILERQAAINRALALGRVPLIASRILRVLDKRGLLGKGLRVVGTNALYCYEAACGVSIDSGLTTTEDIDLLFDARRGLRIIGDPAITSRDLVQLLKLADRSFQPTRQSFRAQNDDGYLVDLIKPQSNPPWAKGKQAVGGQSDLQAAEIEGLAWLENSPAFEQVAIDERGSPVRMVCPDPRAFAIHKLWLSERLDREPLKKARDRDQAFVVAEIVKQYMPQLSFEPAELKMMPKDLVKVAVDTFRLRQPTG